MTYEEARKKKVELEQEWSRILSEGKRFLTEEDCRVNSALARAIYDEAHAER